MKYIPFILLLSLVFVACKDDDMDQDNPTPDCYSLTDILFNPTAKEINLPQGYQPIIQPLGNEMTNEGVQLGRFLFFDPILSVDSTMSCSSCHEPAGNFTDNRAVSTGVDGIAGVRSSMSLVDIVYAEQQNDGLFWDGRVKTLEQQALLPIEDPIELHDTWDNVEEKLRRSDRYPRMFREAFGIAENCDIDRELATMALAQYQRSLISLGNSRYDSVFVLQLDLPTEAESRGFDFFNNELTAGESIPDAECNHCHAPPLFTDNSFRNNGLTFFTDETALDVEDRGLYETTGNLNDIGLFRVPSLRNIEFSAPYMHDGRFNTLEEVVEHYICDFKQSPTLHPLMRSHCDPNDTFDYIDEQGKQDIVAFLKMLSDHTFFDNPDYQSPF